jgi:hypothetical protein
MAVMLDKVVSGGQTGADQAGWRAATAAGIPTGGWMPRGFLTEDGPRPEFRELYGAAELPTDSYAERTRRNVRDSDATVWFGDRTTPGAKATQRACEALGKPIVFVESGVSRPSMVARWLGVHPNISTLNVAGNRESNSPGIGGRVERFLGEVLRRFGYGSVDEG